MTNMYLVCHEGEDGFNADVYVEAENHKQAARHWLMFVVEEWGENLIDKDDLIRVWTAPSSLSGKSKAYSWNEFDCMEFTFEQVDSFTLSSV